MDRAALTRELARRSLAHFVRYFWPQVQPGRPLIWSWYLDAICDHLEAVSRGDIKRLIITLPPRHLKSSCVSVMWPAWEWLHKPELRYLTASYSLRLAVRDAVASRRIMSSPEYRALLGSDPWRFTSDQNEKSRYENNRTGHRICTSPGAGTLGEGGERVVVDDPEDVLDAGSDLQRETVTGWWDAGMSTRGNDPNRTAMVIVMQRLNENDLAGHCLRQGYEHLCLPTLFERDHPFPSHTSLGFRDPRTEEGEMLSPDRFDEAAILAAQKTLGSLGFAGQHQQRPAPAGGAIWQRRWFRTWAGLPGKFDQVLQSWDLNFGGAGDSRASDRQQLRSRSFVVGAVWGVIGVNVYLLDIVRGQWEFAESVRECQRLSALWPEAHKKLVEVRANGPALISILRDSIPGFIEVEPGGRSKIQRALACQPFIEGGNVYVPDRSFAPWVVDYINEVTAFPVGLHDDQVDVTSQLLNYLHGDERGSTLRRLQLLGA